MRTFVVLAVAVAVFAFCCASEDSDAGRAAVLFKEWLAEFNENLCKDVKALFELLRVAGDLLNRANAYAHEGYKEYEQSTKLQKKWTWMWTEATHQDTCKRLIYYSTVENLTSLNGWTGVASKMMQLFLKAVVMYGKLVQWYFLLCATLCACDACDRMYSECLGSGLRRVPARVAVRAPARVAVQAPLRVAVQAHTHAVVLAPAPTAVLAQAAPTFWERFCSFCRWLWQTYLELLCYHGIRVALIWLCVFLYHSNFFVRAAEVYMTVMDPKSDDVVEAWARGKNRTCLSLFLFGWLY